MEREIQELMPAGDTGDHGGLKFDSSALPAGDTGDHVQGRGEGRQWRELYEAVLNNDLKKITQLFSIEESPIDDPQKQQGWWLLQGLNVAGDTALHIAVHQSYDLLRELLDLSLLCPLQPYEGGEITMQNVFGNTPLHEAAAVGCLDAVKLLCRTCPYLTKTKNQQGETAVFRAAAFGKTHVVEFLVSQKIRHEELESHCIRDCDSISILHVAVLGHHIETAFWIQRNINLPLHLRMDKRHGTCLHLLASTPSVFPSGCKSKGWIYYCLPVDEDNTENVDYDDFRYKPFYGLEAALSWMNRAIWHFLAREWPQIETIWSEKRRHTAAINLTKELVPNDLSWEYSTKEDVNLAAINQSGEMGKARIVPVQDLHSSPKSHGPEYRGSDGDQGQNNLSQEHNSKKDTNLAAINQSGEKGKAHVVSIQLLLSDEEIHEVKMDEWIEAKVEGDELKDLQTPLLIAARNGIMEIVEAILKEFPQAIEHTDTKTKENILHVTIQHRQREIFSLVKKKKFPMQRLALRVDKDNNTILHQVACMKFFHFGTKPNPALQLQDELQWFERVKRLMPIHYVMHPNKESKTAKVLFDETHMTQLEKAQKWTKQTSQSCSTIAALIATVVFAAAFTVPGGNTQNGIPNLLHHHLFLVFTIMDIISLTSSLTSLFLFLSILTSPYHMQDFYRSIPQKLMFAFTFLFLSVATTMVAFIITILLTIQLRKWWTTNLICTTALLPISMFILVLRIPLLAGFKDTLRFICKRFMKFIPRCIITKGWKIEKGYLV